MTDLGMTLHPGRSCGADRFGGFRDRRDRLRRSLVMGTDVGRDAKDNVAISSIEYIYSIIE